MPDPPRIILTVGLPGCGKSTYLASLNVNPVSSDSIRRQLTDDESDQTIHARVFALVRHILLQRIELRRPVTYIDATNLTRRDRRPYIKMARDHNCRIEAVWFDIPLAVCKARNAGRARVVPAMAMDLLAARFIPPSTSEGFDHVFCNRSDLQASQY